MAERDPFLRRFERDAVVACAAMAGVALPLPGGGPWMSLAVAGGGLLAAASYRAIKGGVDAVSGGGTRAGALVKYFTRHAILAVAAYVMLVRLRLHPVGVLVGRIVAVRGRGGRGGAVPAVGFPLRAPPFVALARTRHRRMEKLHHELWIVQAVNAVFGPVAAAILRALGRPVPDPAHVIPDYLAMIILIVAALTALSLFVRSRLSVENPGKLQIVLEDALSLLFSGCSTTSSARRGGATCRWSARSRSSSGSRT